MELRIRIAMLGCKTGSNVLGEFPCVYEGFNPACRAALGIVFPIGQGTLRIPLEPCRDRSVCLRAFHVAFQVQVGRKEFVDRAPNWLSEGDVLEAALVLIAPRQGAPRSVVP